MIEVHAEFPQREVIQANAVVDNEEKTVSEVIISAKPEITGVTASVDNETGTPYVDVTETGTGTEFSFDLAFHNLKGEQGIQGIQGVPGQDGQDGISPTAEVTQTAEGATITVTDVSGTTSANILNGKDGQDGQDGADGQAATVTVGTTTTGAAGTNASVVNSGTSSAAILDFTIPKGDTGATGVSITGVSLISTQGLQKTYRMTFSNNTYYDYIVTDGASGSTAWGGISGTLSDQTDLQTELTGLQSQIDAIVSSSDVFDIVGTYAELQAYDISTVPVNDVIKVLVDSTHSNAATYYRCVETGGVKSWSYIGAEGAYYTKSETDTLLNDKYDASNPAGFTTNIGTVTSVNNTQPDANGNVTISVSGGANTDLSNLTATGEAHFQEPLVSGTNIKTINSTSLLGSGNISVQATISDLATIRSGAALGATAVQPEPVDALYAWQYPFSSPPSNIYTKIIPTSTTAIECYDEDGHSIGTGQFVNEPGAIGIIYGQDSDLYSRWSEDDIINLVNLTDNNSNALNIIQADGQWVWKMETVSSVTALGSYDLTSVMESYLPDDNYSYEVLFRIGINRNDNSGTNTQYYLFDPDLITSGQSVDNSWVGIQADGANWQQGNAAGMVILKPDRKLTLNLAGYKLNSSKCVALAYHRIGTNA